MGTNMKHYAIDEWADFTRGLLTDAVRQEMQTHLSDGCAKCREQSEFSTKLTETCTSLTKEPVPEFMIRLARAIFPVRMQDRPGAATGSPSS